MTDEYESFTVVFEGDIRRLPGNPHKLDTPFGKIRSIGVGDAFKAPDACDDNTAQTPPPSTHVRGVETAVRSAGLKARDDLLERLADGGTVDNDLADYMSRIVDECVRAALATTEGSEG